MHHPIRTGQRQPFLERGFTQGGRAIDFSTWTGLSFCAAKVGGGGTMTGGVTSSPALGILRYAFDANDTTVKGTYQGCFKGTPPGGTEVTLPTEGEITIIVSDSPC